jgi:signal transduction histidine kinase
LVVLPVLTVVLVRLGGILTLPSQLLLYLLAVVVVALVGGRVPALVAAAAAAALLAYYFIPPLNDFAITAPDDMVALVGFLLVAVAVSSVVGLAARRAREAETLATANAESREELRVLADEQAALRRVATLVARAAWPDEVFAAVTEEIGQVLDADQATMSRYDADGTVTLVAGWHSATVPVGTRWRLGGQNVHTQVIRTGRPARIDRYADASGPSADVGRRLGISSAVGVPIKVEDRVWGVVLVTSTRPERLPGQTEARLVGFTELVGTAIANADSRAQLTASRARIIAAADDARRRIERDLHDGTQQRLITLSFAVRRAQAMVPAELPQLQTQLGGVADELREAIDELRELARGIHPAILSKGGLDPALRTLARRAALPVRLDIRTTTPVADPTAVATYYVVSEALTNTTKHAHASQVHVTVEQRDAILHLSIRDDGIGGADAAGGSGLIGLRDRVQALGGTIKVTSRPGEGTAIVVELPVQPN